METSISTWPRLARAQDLIFWAGQLIDRLRTTGAIAANVANGDLAANGTHTLYLRSPNGARWAIGVSDAGALTVTAA